MLTFNVHCSYANRTKASNEKMQKGAVKSIAENDWGKKKETLITAFTKQYEGR